MTTVRYSGSSKMTEHRNVNGLQLHEIATYAPSILADCAHDSRGKRYAFISTKVILDALAKAGFIPVEVRQTKVRDVNRREFTKHLVRFRHPDAKPNKDGDYPEIILLNSHDGTSAYRLFSGYFRMLCSNGLIAGDISSDIKIRHSGKVANDVVEGAFRVIENLEHVTNEIDVFKSINLIRQERLAFADAARQLRWGDESPVLAGELALPHRFEDKGNDLWTTFNTVQESIVKGGICGKASSGRKLTTRPVQSVTENVKLNRALWQMAKAMSDIKLQRLDPSKLMHDLNCAENALTNVI